LIGSSFPSRLVTISALFMEDTHSLERYEKNTTYSCVVKNFAQDNVLKVKIQALNFSFELLTSNNCL